MMVEPRGICDIAVLFLAISSNGYQQCIRRLVLSTQASCQTDSQTASGSVWRPLSLGKQLEISAQVAGLD